MTGSFDPIALIEQGYAQRQGQLAWMREMAAAITESIDRDRIGVQFFRLGGQGYETPQRWIMRANNPFADERAAIAFGHEVQSTMSPKEMQRIGALHRAPGLYTLRSTIGRYPEILRNAGFHESVAIVVHDPEGSPALFVTPLRREFEVDRATQSLWRRLASHLGAAWRLSGREPRPDATDVECVLTPGGSVLHAQGEGQSEAARERIRAAIKDVDRARTRRGRANPEAALELWRGLFSGRWSLIDHFDSDGKRFLLARRNDPRAPGPAALPLRQRQILFYVGAGWSNKEVGYALGISGATVATHLHHALASLNLASRAEWIRICSELATG